MKAVFILLLSATLTAQTPNISRSRTPRQQGPRAIAVIRWQADLQGRARPELLPVCILEDGKIFDASIYKTSPEPMALERGTVYEAQQHGLPVGLFTITAPAHAVSEGHPWIALGSWKLDVFKSTENKNVQQANATIGTPKAENPLPPVDEEEVHRKATQVYDESGRPIDNPKDDDPPTMDKRGRRERIDRSPQAAPPEKPKEQPKPTTQDDPDRPKLHKGPPVEKPSTPAPEKPTPAAVAVDNDPNRPRLKRGRPTANDEVGEPSAKLVEPAVIAHASVNQPRTYEMAAVSDADLSRIPQGYEFRTTLAEREAYLRKLQALVDTEFQPKTANSAGPRSPLRRAKAPEPSRFADVHLAMFDLDNNNSPEMVLTGTYVVSPTQRTPFMLTARGDYEGNPRKLMFVRDDRFEFIDAVDLDGDGPGELLFRRSAANGTVFVLYRASPDGLTEVFRGGTAE